MHGECLDRGDLPAVCQAGGTSPRMFAARDGPLEGCKIRGRPPEKSNLMISPKRLTGLRVCEWIAAASCLSLAMTGIGMRTDCFTTFHSVRNDALIIANRHRERSVAIYCHCRILPN